MTKVVDFYTATQEFTALEVAAAAATKAARGAITKALGALVVEGNDPESLLEASPDELLTRAAIAAACRRLRVAAITTADRERLAMDSRLVRAREVLALSEQEKGLLRKAKEALAPPKAEPEKKAAKKKPAKKKEPAKEKAALQVQ